MEELISKQKTVMISSSDKSNNLNISCAPYVFYKNKIYIYISKIAKHYENLLSNQNISVMIIEDEKDTKVIFDRKRISFNCIAKKVDESQEILEKFDESHGFKMMKVLKKMDFDVFELNILNGRFVSGFSKVFDISIKNEDILLQKVEYEQHIYK